MLVTPEDAVVDVEVGAEVDVDPDAAEVDPAVLDEDLLPEAN